MNHTRPAQLAPLCRMIAARYLPAASLVAMGLGLAAPAQAAVEFDDLELVAGVIYVTAGATDNTVNSNCSIVEAFAAAQNNTAVDQCVAGSDGFSGGDVIELTSGTYTFPATSGNVLPTVSSRITVHGNGSVLNLGGSWGLTTVSSGSGNLTLERTTVSGAAGTFNGGLMTVYSGASLALVDSVVSGNAKGYGHLVRARPGNVSVLRSTIVNNGTGLYVYGGNLNVENSTLSNSNVEMYVGYTNATLNHATIAASSPPGGGALITYHGNTSISNSIIVGSCTKTGPGGVGISTDGASILKGDDTLCGGLFSNAAPDPLLGPMQDNGGYTPTRALLAGSPAIDAATGSVLATDQRGVARPIGAAADLGAYEAPPDTTPDAFSFPNAANVSLNTVTASKVLTPVGYNTATTVAVRNGEYRINGGSWTGAAGTISPGQTLQLRTTSASTVSTGKSMAVVVGGVTSSFIVRTGPAAAPSDSDPDVFSIANQANAYLNVFAKSRPVTPVGYDAPATVTVAPAGCYYIINGGTPGDTTGSISPGQTLQLARQTPSTNATKFFCDVTVGATKVRWIGKTQ